MAFGVHVFHCVATVLWIRHVHVLGSNFEVFPVFNKNHVYSKFLLNAKAKQLSCESEIHQQQQQQLLKRQKTACRLNRYIDMLIRAMFCYSLRYIALVNIVTHLPALELFFFIHHENRSLACYFLNIYCKNVLNGRCFYENSAEIQSSNTRACGGCERLVRQVAEIWQICTRKNEK